MRSPFPWCPAPDAVRIRRTFHPRATEMTSYTYSASLSDSEMLVLEEALKRYKAFCKEELAKGGSSPFFAHLHAIKSIRTKLFRGVYPPVFAPDAKLFTDDD